MSGAQKTAQGSGRTLAIAISGGAIVFCVGVTQSAFAFESYYANRFAPGVLIGPLDVGGKTKDEVRKTLIEFERAFEQKGIRVSFQNVETTLYPLPVTLESDIPIDTVRPLAQLDIEGTLDVAFAIGHSDLPARELLSLFSGLFQKRSITPLVETDDAEIKASIQKEFSSFITVPVRPHYAFVDGRVAFVSGVLGEEFEYARAVADVRSSLQALTLPVARLERHTTVPEIADESARKHLPDVLSLLEAIPSSFTHEGREFPVSRTDGIAWIAPQKTSDAGSVLGYDHAAIENFLAHVIAPQVEVQPAPPHFTIDNGAIRAQSGPVTGRTLDVEKTLETLLESIASRSPSSPLTVKEIPSPIAEIANDLTVTEIVAQAQTDFKGSPQNRRKNIATGMSRIDGLVVMPDEEFSLIKALGPIEKEYGFLPELVIKGNRTTPEYGGGLCQVSTTLFRAVAHAGLPVLERRNHSYRVSYYEPPVGFDATIYFPKPDFRFKNDTGSPVLILASVKGTVAEVTLWGTRDGRTVEIDTPTVFNVRKPGATKIVETDDLKPGVKKCTEKAHSGADAFFERRVTYPSGEQMKETFRSHYVVWPAVCLVGKKPDEQPIEETAKHTQAQPETETPEHASSTASEG